MLTAVGRSILALLGIGVLAIMAIFAFWQAIILFVGIPCATLDGIRDWHKRKIMRAAHTLLEEQVVKQRTTDAEWDTWIEDVMNTEHPESSETGPWNLSPEDLEKSKREWPWTEDE